MFNILKLAKLVLSILIVYMIWFKEAFANVNIVLYGTTLLATGCVVIDCIHNKALKMNVFPAALLLYGVFSFLSGAFVALDFRWFISSMVTYFAFATIVFDCAYVINRMHDYSWIVDSILIASILCIIQTIFFGSEYRVETIVRTMSESNNPNVLSFTMIMGLAMVFIKNKPRNSRMILVLVMVFLHLFVIVLSGSRKGLLCGLALTCLWFLSVFTAEKGINKKKIRYFVLISVAVVIGIYYALTEFVNTASFARFQLFADGQSDRTILIKDGIEFWKQSPIIGIGFAQYQVMSPYGIYSHNTYVECLTCTGIVGVLIFFSPIVGLMGKMLGKLKRKNTTISYSNRMCFSILLVLLAMGLGQIIYYDGISHLLLLLLCFVITEENDRIERLALSDEGGSSKLF